MNREQIPLFDSARAQELIGLDRGWEEVVEPRYGNRRVQIIDSDFTGLDPNLINRELGDRADVKRVKERYISLLEGVQGLDVMDQRRTLLANLRASDVFLATLDHPVDFEHYVRQTLGVPLEFFDEKKDIAEARRVLADNLNRARITGPNLQISFEDYRRNHLSPEQVRNGMVNVIQKNLDNLLDYLGLADLNPVIHTPLEIIEFFNDRTAPFRMEGYHRDGKSKLRVNTAYEYYPGDEEYFAHHEFFVHILDQLVGLSLIQRRQVIPELGIRTLHGPQVYANEGLACTLPYFLPVGFLGITPFGDISYSFRRLRDMVLNNAHIIANAGPKDRTREEAFIYAKNELKGILRDNEIRRILESVVYDQIDRVASFAYGRGTNDYIDISDMLETDNKRRAFLLRNLGMPLTYQQVEQAALETLYS